MNNIFVYIETEGGKVADVSLELLTKARSLSLELGCKVEAIVLGDKLEGVPQQLADYGAQIVHIADSPELAPFRTLPHTSIVCGVFKEEQPQIALFGASSIGRDLAPRVSSALHSGLTADCTQLEIGEHTDPKTKKEYKDLLYQIRPAFGGNIIATIINPDHRPQMATVREGVMRMEKIENAPAPEIKVIDHTSFLTDADMVVEIVSREIQERKVNLKGAPVIVAGGYGVGSKEGFELLQQVAELFGGEVGASRAAVDAGFTEHARQIGQTGTTVRPKLYIACGISGQIQHTAGMDGSSIIISINNDPEAPINKLADYAIIGDYATVLPKFVSQYKQSTK